MPDPDSLLFPAGRVDHQIGTVVRIPRSGVGRILRRMITKSFSLGSIRKWEANIPDHAQEPLVTVTVFPAYWVNMPKPGPRAR